MAADIARSGAIGNDNHGDDAKGNDALDIHATGGEHRDKNHAAPHPAQRPRQTRDDGNKKKEYAGHQAFSQKKGRFFFDVAKEPPPVNRFLLMRLPAAGTAFVFDRRPDFGLEFRCDFRSGMASLGMFGGFSENFVYILAVRFEVAIDSDIPAFQHFPHFFLLFPVSHVIIAELRPPKPL